jgi:RHS repeat-associated protein
LKSKTQGTQTTTYRYDVFGNLKAADLPNGLHIDYLADGANRRIGKKVNGVLVQGFVYESQLRIAAEISGTGAMVSSFVYGDKVNVPEFMVKGGMTFRIVTDHLGSVRLVVNTSNGAVVQRMDYDEWGNVTSDTSPGFQPFGFAGGLYDRDTKLVRFGARDYDAGVGRWTAKDPIRFEGDNSNLYAYINDSPLGDLDPSGLMGQGSGASQGRSIQRQRKPPLPSVDDPCVIRWINENYGDVLGFMVDIGNLQMYFPSANDDYKRALKEGGEVILEKSAVTKGPGIAGRALTRAIPGNLAVGHVVGSGLATFGGVASGVVEVAGAFMTPFATAAMAQAREACSCQK